MTVNERKFDERFKNEPRIVKVKGTVDDFIKLHPEV